MSETTELATAELVELIGRVFAPGNEDRGLALLVDLPGGGLPDRSAWRARRELAAGWRDRLAGSDLGLNVALFVYPNVGSNNADLPGEMWPVAAGEALPADGSALDPAAAVSADEVFSSHQILLAPTELSATAPLKVAARRFGFRAATMPGFSPAMVPALRLDLEEVDRRVRRIAALLDDAEGAEVVFRAPSGEGDTEHRLFLDLRHRTAHVSSALLREPGTAGNLPSGEAYIVPYEGERPGDPSRSAGTLPVEIDREVVHFRIEENRAVSVDSGGPVSAREAERLDREPARGNLAELGLGVLAGMGVDPIGSTLLDEKLGLHIAFGRSEHFGGTVGPGDFHDSREVIHLDHIYLPSLQPGVAVPSVDLVGSDGTRHPLMRDGEYLL
jgi:leucyl aminopeptidase (aminopeptidase T)